MRIPRDLSGADLVKRLGKLGYAISRQTGSHLRLTRNEGGEHHVTIPNHDPLRIGTLAAILDSVAKHLGVSRAELLECLLG
ncbi:MAG: type II toxin-antitoxin system HicA family toxin [Betaproteobacteria bacterium]|nr:type II toxin-antitoxin system HicA family toxin [Betaproteobacteria bacterium]MDE2185874.1 type II toxin-antitoxin system HicA family toxin [Betaproteobacteria bacterium]